MNKNFNYFNFVKILNKSLIYLSFSFNFGIRIKKNIYIKKGFNFFTQKSALHMPHLVYDNDLHNKYKIKMGMCALWDYISVQANIFEVSSTINGGTNKNKT